MRVKWIWAICLILLGGCTTLISAQVDQDIWSDPSLRAPYSKGGAVQISGKVYDQTFPKVVLKMYPNPLSQEEVYYALPLNESGFFSMQFWAKAPMPVTLMYGDQTQELFIQPNDHLFLSFRGTQLQKSLAFSGKGEVANRYLLREDREMERWPEETIYYELLQRDPAGFQQFIDSLNDIRARFFRSYPPMEKQKFSSDFLHYIRADRMYWYAYQLLQYRTEHPIAFGKAHPQKLSDTYYQFLAEVFIEHPNALYNNWYIQFIDELKRWRAEQPDFRLGDSVQMARVIAPSLLLLQAPDQPPILQEIPKNTLLRSLNQRSEKRSKIMMGDEIKEDYWYQVQTVDGIKGWVPGIGIAFESHPLNRKPDSLFTEDVALFLEAREAIWNNRAIHSTFWSDLAQQSHSSKLAAILAEGTAYQQIKDPLIRPFGPRPLQIVVAPNVRIDTLSTSSIPAYSPTLPVDPSPATSSKMPAPASDQSRTQWTKLAPPVEDAIPQHTSLTYTQTPASELHLVLFKENILFQQESYPFEKKGKDSEAQMELRHAQTGFLERSKQKIPVYLLPGDALRCSYSPGQIHFTGKGSIHNQFLSDFQQAFASKEEDLRQHIEHDSPAAFQKWMRQVYHEKQAFLEQYPHRPLFTPAFLAFAKAEINYWYGYNLLNYPWEHPLFHDQDIPMALNDTYYHFLDKLEVSNDDALLSPNYTYFLSQFFDYQKERPDMASFSDLELAQRFLNGRALEYYTAKLLAIRCKRGKAMEAGPAIQAFMEGTGQPVYKNLLYEVYTEARGLENGAPAPSFELTSLDGSRWALESLRGKVVYLDFWATWCMSCTYQMRNSKEWKKAYPDDAVAFVYVSLDQDLNAWKTFLASNNISGIHLADDPKADASAKSRYKVKKLPAVFIIDQAGDLVYQSYQDSGKVRVKEVIDQLVKRPKN